jgi:hypothetical protein
VEQTLENNLKHWFKITKINETSHKKITNSSNNKLRYEFNLIKKIFSFIISGSVKTDKNGSIETTPTRSKMLEKKNKNKIRQKFLLSFLLKIPQTLLNLVYN